MGNEYIVCAAIWVNDHNTYPHQPKNIPNGIVIAGLRHHNCFTSLAQMSNVTRFNTIQGFLTSKDRFVDRTEALEIARRQNQLIMPDRANITQLMSEMIY